MTSLLLRSCMQLKSVIVILRIIPLIDKLQVRSGWNKNTATITTPLHIKFNTRWSTDWIVCFLEPEVCKQRILQDGKY